MRSTSPFFQLVCLFLCLGLTVSASVEQAGEKKKETDQAEKKIKPSASKKGNESKKGVGSEKAPQVEKGSKTKEEEDQRYHVVKSELFEVTTKVSGVVESKKLLPISMKLEEWSEMSIVDVVPHGTVVEKGDMLLELDREPLQEAMEKLSDSMPLKEVTLKLVLMELEKLEQTTPITIKREKQSLEESRQDFDYYVDVRRPMRERDEKQKLKNSKNFLLYAEEELNQLKKMYEADDLTEETEEIILLRARNSVDSARWALEMSEERTRQALETQLPREHDSLGRQLELKEISSAMAEENAKEALKKKRLEVEAKERELDEAMTKLAALEKDLDKMLVVAPRAGIVYYGMSQRGKWTTAASIERKLIPGGQVSMNEILMTLADPDQLQLRLSVPDSKLKGFKKGLSGAISLKWDPEAELEGQVVSVSYVPLPDQSFDAVMSISNPDRVMITPGMKAEAEIVIHKTNKALLVPHAALRQSDGKSTVTLKDGEVRTVKTGHSNAQMVEVLNGLRAGDEVMVGEGTEKKAEQSDSSEAETEGDK
ncbi:MAG: HlyD family efflux transporter periplasmic adaptor subunit [Verrucomicrobiota bacterium]